MRKWVSERGISDQILILSNGTRNKFILQLNTQLNYKRKPREEKEYKAREIPYLVIGRCTKMAPPPVCAFSFLFRLFFFITKWGEFSDLRDTGDSLALIISNYYIALLPFKLPLFYRNKITTAQRGRLSLLSATEFPVCILQEEGLSRIPQENVEKKFSNQKQYPKRYRVK